MEQRDIAAEEVALQPVAPEIAECCAASAEEADPQVLVLLGTVSLPPNTEEELVAEVQGTELEERKAKADLAGLLAHGLHSDAYCCRSCCVRAERSLGIKLTRNLRCVGRSTGRALVVRDHTIRALHGCVAQLM